MPATALRPPIAIRCSRNTYGGSGSERDAADRLRAYLAGPTVAQSSDSAESPAVAGLDEYRYRDSNPPSDQ